MSDNARSLKKYLKYFGAGVLIILIIIVLGISYLVVFQPSIPTENIKIEITPARLERGKYLAYHVAVCMDCHSTRDWEKYAGPLIDGTEGKGGEPFDQRFGFPGSYYAKNITPFKLKGWTDGEILRAVTSGVNKEGKALFPVMPYLHYGNLDRDDLYSIIAFIKSLPAIANNVPEANSDFPMNIIIHTIPQKPNFGTRPDTSDKINYGKYLVTMGTCIDCHSKDNKGELIKGLEFAGGREFPMPFGVIQSANITPDEETGIGNWTEDVFINQFKSFDPNNGYVPRAVKPNEFNTIMPWTMYAGMKTEDLKAIYAYLRTLKPVKNQVLKLKPL